ncbi:MAG TPA: hypothetical protein PLG66_06345, partial [Calditrichia bacterium]|nr:hypothetical protein [Calditrichia bacterium]
WGRGMWNDSLLIIDTQHNGVLSCVNLNGSRQLQGALYYLPLENGELNYVNTVQTLRGEEFVTVLDSYVKDDLTILHETFHKLHFSLVNDLSADPISYLDGFEARILLRSEFSALKNAITAMNHNASEDSILAFIRDAFLFRKIRQTRFAAFVPRELELETVEGLAVYTSFKLSRIPNKFLLILREIDNRTAAESLTRAFAYASGAAYGFILDYLGLDWRADLADRRVFDFLKIYETDHLKREIEIEDGEIEAARSRNGYQKIEQEESIRKERTDKLTAFYQKLFFEKGVVKVDIPKPVAGFNMSYDMNGTFVLEGEGTVYSSVSGTDTQKRYFGNFEMKSALGEGGALMIDSADQYTFIFPKPLKVEKAKIVGEKYSITLNSGWKLSKTEAGNYRIVKEDKP